MKKRNGFTLIELLAVTVVLIAIILIAIPTVTRLTTETKQKAFEDSAYGIIKAGDLYYSRREMMGEELVETRFDFPNNMKGLEFSGTIPKSGSMLITAEGDIGLAISNGKYCITKDYDSSDIKVTKDIKNCVLPTRTFTNGIMKSENGCIKDGVCSSGTLVNVQVSDTENYNFYVIKDTGTKLTLIMDRNLGDNIEWIDHSDYTTENNKDETPDTCSYSACNDEGPITAISVLKSRTADWNYITEAPYTYSGIGEDGLTRVYEDITITTKARLLTYDEAISTTLGCTEVDGSCPDWLYKNLFGSGDDNTNAYWLSTGYLSDPSIAWLIPYNGRVSWAAGYTTGAFGLRPVIELSK